MFCFTLDKMEELTNELSNAYEVLTEAILKSENLQNDWLSKEIDWKKREENFINHQNELLKTNTIQAQEILKLEGDLLTNDKIHAEEISKVQGELSGLKSDQDGFKDKIAALRSVARALESENQLLAGEKENLQNFKTQFCKDNGALK